MRNPTQICARVPRVNYLPEQEHWLLLQLQLLPKGQHVVPKFVAQQTSVALHILVSNHEAHLPSIGHFRAATGLPVPTPAWQEPYGSAHVGPVQPCLALPLHLQVHVAASNVPPFSHFRTHLHSESCQASTGGVRPMRQLLYSTALASVTAASENLS